MSDLFRKNEQELMEIEPNEIFYKNFKAFYYMMNATPDSVTKAFKKPVIVDQSDISGLNKRITDKIKNHFEEEMFSIGIHVSLNDKKSIDFSSWTEFENHQWCEPEIITNFIINWDFLIKLPKYKLPQKHNLMVKLSSVIKPEEMLNLIISGNIEDIEGIEQSSYPIIARVDFIDRDLGDELINLVKEWIDGLSCNYQEKSSLTMKFLYKNKRKFALFTNYFFSFLLLCFGIILLNVEVNSFDVFTVGEINIGNFLGIINLSFIYIMVFLFAHWMSGVFARGIFESLSEYGDIHIFNITKGDKNEQKRLENKDKKNQKWVLIKSVLNLVLNVACGVVASILFSVFVK